MSITSQGYEKSPAQRFDLINDAEDFIRPEENPRLQYLLQTLGYLGDSRMTVRNGRLELVEKKLRVQP